VPDPAGRLSGGQADWLIEHLPMGVIVQDAEARILEANPAALRLLDMSLEDLREQSTRRQRWHTTDEAGQPLSPERQPAFLALQSGQVCTAILGVTSVAGKQLWLKFTAIPTPPTTAGDRPGRVYSVFEDVTESQRLQLEFQRSEGRYKALVAATSQYVWTNSPEGEMHGEQPDWAALTGQTREQYQGYGWAEAIHPDDQQATVERWQAAVATRGHFEAEHRVFTRSGYRSFSVRGMPLLDAQGALIEWVGLHTDITPLREAQAALEALNVTLEARAIERSLAYDDLARFNSLLLGSAGEGILGLDREGRARFANPAAADLLGYSVEELQGQPMHALIHARLADGTPYPEDECPVSQLLRRTAEPGTDETESRRIEGEVFWRKDGTAIPVEYVVTALPPSTQDGRGEENGGAVLIFQDVTAAQAARAALEQAIVELERSNRELEQFAYVSSHDLQEPLRTVGSYAELLGRRYGGQLDARADQYLKFMQDAVARMRQLINDLLSFSRIGRNEVVMKPVQLEQVMQDVRASFETVLGESGAELTWTELPTVLGNESQLGQLMSNLVSNALKFRQTDAAPRITLHSRLDEGQVHLTVSDNGIGIAPEFQERVFGLFQRLHRRDEYEGTGLGLAICRKIVQGHGGEIWLESEAGKGTTVHLRLRLATDADTATSQTGTGQNADGHTETNR